MITIKDSGLYNLRERGQLNLELGIRRFGQMIITRVVEKKHKIQRIVLA